MIFSDQPMQQRIRMSLALGLCMLGLAGCGGIRPFQFPALGLLEGSSSSNTVPQKTAPRDSLAVASQERLPTTLPTVELVVTPEVTREINRYLLRHNVGLQQAFERRSEYLPMMEAVFRDEGLPPELLALPIIESGFDRAARSPVGARGLWQFMPSTARYYGLVVNKKVDQRLDPVLSTIAAAKFLRDLYNDHGDWHLALAAYNAGSGGIRRALYRTKTSNYWQLARCKKGISSQTQQFVPKFLAAAVIARSWNRYDLVQLAANPNLLLVGSNPEV